MKKLSIVIPTFNESKNVELLLNEIDKAINKIDYEVIFVDDSNDDTPKVLEKISKKNKKVRYEHRTNCTGLATAVLRGFELAKGDYLACMDADLQHPPITLLHMYAALESGCDMCIPSRLIPGGNDGGLNWYRKFVSGTARNIGKVMLSSLKGISDPTSGLFMFKKDVIKNADLRPIGWKIMIEVIAMGNISKIIETPYTFQDRNDGESKLSSKVTLEYLKQVKNLRKRQVKKNIQIERWTSEKLNKEIKKYN